MVVHAALAVHPSRQCHCSSQHRRLACKRTTATDSARAIATASTGAIATASTGAVAITSARSTASERLGRRPEPAAVGGDPLWEVMGVERGTVRVEDALAQLGADVVRDAPVEAIHAHAALGLDLLADG